MLQLHLALVLQIKNQAQLDAALAFLSNVGPESFQSDKFDEACGVGRPIVDYFRDCNFYHFQECKHPLVW